uniref:SRCR domain-containing protein n=1 Tax=Scleropages formosus TaxID=113540 RepID=A0A8C9SK53_SCLFO
MVCGLHLPYGVAGNRSLPGNTGHKAGGGGDTPRTGRPKRDSNPRPTRMQDLVQPTAPPLLKIFINNGITYLELKVCCCGHITSLFPGPDDLRLVNGSSPCSGTVEVYRWGQWGTVAQYNWDLNDAAVVCRQLGCALHRGSHFGQGEGPIWSKHFQCEGHESFLHECLTTDRPEENCTHGSGVGLICTGEFLIPKKNNCLNLTTLLILVFTGYTGLRLMNGPDRCSGRVQLRYKGKWGTVCNASWDMRASDVLCHQLKCGHAVGQAWFGEGSGPIWPDVFQCHGNETQLSQCAVSPWSRAACSHGQDVGVICSALSTYMPTTFEMIQRHVAFIFTGSSPQVSFLTLSAPVDHRSLRLMGGDGDCAGRLEVFHEGSWGTVCDDSWGLAEAQVACRQLRCGTALSRQNPVPAYFGPGSGPIWLGRLGCTGSESSLWDCPSARFEQQDCGHKEDDAGVTCAVQDWQFSSILTSSPLSPGPEDVRLVKGGSRCAGTVEVNREGQWGTVVQFYWDINDAEVVCRELDCGSAISAPRRAYFGEGSGQELLTEVSCNGTESTLSMCQSENANQIRAVDMIPAPHIYDAGVICSGR